MNGGYSSAMAARQTVPRQWLVAGSRNRDELWTMVKTLPAGSGILVLCQHWPGSERARLLTRLRRTGRRRNLIVVDERAGEAARVHSAGEIRKARLRRVPLMFLSPIFDTRSHPQWSPLPRNRIAALIRLARTPVIALGGMNERRFRTVQPLGFQGWAGIDGWKSGSALSRPARPSGGRAKSRSESGRS